MRTRREILLTAAAAAVLTATAAWWVAGAVRGGSGLERTLADARAQTADELSETRRTAIVTAAERVGPAVVSVNVVATQVVRDPIFDDPFFRGFFLPPRERRREVQGLGSGFIVSQDGYVVTNQHVVRGASRIVVTLVDGRQMTAEMIAEDDLTDLAVLKVQAEDLPVAPLGDSDDLLIGEWSIAIGNPFGYLLADRNPSVTVGVISAIGREVRPEPGAGQSQVWSNMIQTDAAINPGNSGGPLVNANGEVIGVNAFIFSGGSGGSIGLGFAIPINRVRRVLQDVIEYGSIRRPWTGLHLAPLELSEGQVPVGARVQRVDPGSPAERADLRPGDIVLSTDGRSLQSALEWEGRLLDLPSETPIRLEVERGGSTFEVDLRPSQDPLVDARRIATDYGAAFVVLDSTLASHLGLTSASGLYVERLASGSPLRALGLQPADVVLAVDSRRLVGAGDAEVLGQFLRAGRRGRLLVEREGRVGQIQVF
ncbi:MAG TPA: trypsin-like peptidase domain-containing protein [Gemmatimonadota bacterium]|nr:trypsin-like peptidase domain-containing protein [Gemmatimonadota bacterium]